MTRSKLKEVVEKGVVSFSLFLFYFSLVNIALLELMDIIWHICLAFL